MKAWKAFPPGTLDSHRWSAHGWLPTNRVGAVLRTRLCALATLSFYQTCGLDMRPISNLQPFSESSFSTLDSRASKSMSIDSNAGSISSEAGIIPHAEDLLLTELRRRSKAILSSSLNARLKPDHAAIRLSMRSLQVATVLPMAPRMDHAWYEKTSMRLSVNVKVNSRIMHLSKVL